MAYAQIGSSSFAPPESLKEKRKVRAWWAARGPLGSRVGTTILEITCSTARLAATFLPTGDMMNRQVVALVFSFVFAAPTVAAGDAAKAPQPLAFRFESLAGWSFDGIGKPSLSLQRVEGKRALALSELQWIALTSDPLSSEQFRGQIRKVSYALYVPEQQPNEWWIGNTSASLSVPSLEIWSEPIGEVDLKTLKRGRFSRVEFTVPERIARRLAAGFSDLRVRLVLNVSPGSSRYLVDDLRLGS
jgi:hypothetical protein